MFILAQNLTGFDDFVGKIQEMGLTDFILKKSHNSKTTIKKSTEMPENWWYLG